MALLSLRAAVNPQFRNSFFRYKRYLKPGVEVKVSMASAVASLLWWSTTSVFLALAMFNVQSERLESFLGPFGALMLLSSVSFLAYDYWKSEHAR